MKPLYWRTQTEKTFCGECGEPVMLLGTDYQCLPSFYICTGGGCGWVAQIGVGPVPDTTITDEDEEGGDEEETPEDRDA